MPAEKRFWAKVKKGDGCWEWQAAVNNKGYGVFGISKGKLIYAHRYAFFLGSEDADQSLEICHRCDNPRCVRREHLFVGSHADNMSDMATKERSGVALLNPASVRAMWRLKGEGRKRQDIADLFGVSLSTVKDVFSRKNWSWVDGTHSLPSSD